MDYYYTLFGMSCLLVALGYVNYHKQLVLPINQDILITYIHKIYIIDTALLFMYNVDIIIVASCNGWSDIISGSNLSTNWMLPLNDSPPLWSSGLEGGTFCL